MVPSGPRSSIATDISAVEERPLARVTAIRPDELLHAQDLQGIGTVLFSLLSHWDAWLERRVEEVQFLDADTVVRRVSVDFILPELFTPFFLNDLPVHLVPLGLLRKRTLNDFDLYDETRRALPLLSRRHNGPIAASVLVAAARAWVGTGLRPGRRRVPQPIVDDLWTIATADAPVALETWHALGIAKTDNRVERLWRAGLVASSPFIALASDLSQNFLVLTPLRGAVGRRRVVKFSYQEPGGLPEVELHPLAWLKKRSKRRTAGTGAAADVPGVGKAIVRIAAVVSGDEAPGDPVAGVAFALKSKDHVYRVVTGPDGVVPLSMWAGEYTVTQEVVPAGYWPTVLEAQCVVKPSVETGLVWQYRRGPSLIEDPRVRTRVTVRRKLARAFALAPKPVEILVPSIGQCGSYHMQFQGADGLHVTSARLTHSPTVRGHDADPGAEVSQASLTPGLQRAAASASRVPQSHRGLWRVDLRPRPSTIVRAATLASGLSLVSIATVALALGSLSVAPGPAVALLLVVPGGLSAYVARAREHLFTTEVLVGLRVLSLLNGLWAFLAAGVVVLAREQTIVDGDPRVGDVCAAAYLALVLVLICNVATLTTLATAWRRASRPPERQNESSA